MSYESLSFSGKLQSQYNIIQSWLWHPIYHCDDQVEYFFCQGPAIPLFIFVDWFSAFTRVAIADLNWFLHKKYNSGYKSIMNRLTGYGFWILFDQHLAPRKSKLILYKPFWAFDCVQIPFYIRKLYSEVMLAWLAAMIQRPKKFKDW